MKKNIEKKGSMLSSKKQYGIQDLRASLFDKSKGSTLDKINSFTKYAGRQNIAKLVAQYEMLMMTKNVLGNIIEGGIFHGSGLLGWANLAVSLEPYNYQCKIIGFDTFTGSTGITSKDQTLSNIKSVRPGTGLKLSYFNKILGKKVKKNCKFGQPVKLKEIKI